jgi:hypothetical protein
MKCLFYEARERIEREARDWLEDVARNSAMFLALDSFPQEQRKVKTGAFQPQAPGADSRLTAGRESRRFLHWGKRKAGRKPGSALLTAISSTRRQSELHALKKYSPVISSAIQPLD